MNYEEEKNRKIDELAREVGSLQEQLKNKQQHIEDLEKLITEMKADAQAIETSRLKIAEERLRRC